jgi:hypothetical protein
MLPFFLLYLINPSTFILPSIPSHSNGQQSCVRMRRRTMPRIMNIYDNSPFGGILFIGLGDFRQMEQANGIPSQPVKSSQL